MAARRLGRAVLSLNRKVISVDVFNHLLRSARAEEGWVHLSALVQLVFFFFFSKAKIRLRLLPDKSWLYFSWYP